MEEEEKKGGWKLVLSLIFISIVTISLFIYWFVPFNTINFGIGNSNYNFSLVSNSSMQFYDNLRFPKSEISYLIYNCPLDKKNEMEQAFEILGNKTVLEFYSVGSKEEISITCESKNKFAEGLFIAGEGGPTNITKTTNFNVIANGKILLIRDSKCEIPNVALHELLHVLGFRHSSNPKNIMYNMSKCGQTIGDDVTNLIDDLYSYESLPDLALRNVTAIIEGKYLNTNLTLANDGLIVSQNSKINIYADFKLVKELEIGPMEVGYGKIMMLSNIWINQLSVDELRFELVYSYPELSKENNQIVLNTVLD